MLWFWLSILTAFLSASEAAIIKRWLGDLEPFEMTAFPLAYSLPWLLLLIIFMDNPGLAPQFWTSLAILVPVNAAGYTLTMRAINLSPLSLTMPFLAFTPLVTIGTGRLILGETPGPWGVVGIGMIVMGSYVLNLGEGGGKSILGPFKAIAREKGSLCMLAAATIFGLAAVMGKKLVLESSPLYGGTIFFLFHNSLLILLFFATGKVAPSRLLKRPLAGTASGLIYLLHSFVHLSAVAIAATAYMVAVKRLNGVFSVIYGGMIFKEEHIRTRLAGAACMSLGAGLIALAG